jgi:hypothetical protein
MPLLTNGGESHPECGRLHSAARPRRAGAQKRRHAAQRSAPRPQPSTLKASRLGEGFERLDVVSSNPVTSNAFRQQA